METRANIACDQCHGHKLKCTPLSQGCVRCTRLAIRCTYTRLPKKRGRKSTRSRPSPALVQHAPDYPVLDCLSGLSILSPEKEKTE
ncbi:hypothetical protein BP00DRAFT_165433 [Aspergillus indologenus CBS 114.80]|uniref:Zn(2)-C6 fungal-type domain-containing protein n=1 Tax=Aspergillus indologenus CBS 114.80 TaxID=1450541 RepID=A0A2V5IA84_9EURO|nr:hypothetical protein BP00DRAFT_165433 [Aspergillus indologenus CBS 114.80]